MRIGKYKASVARYGVFEPESGAVSAAFTFLVTAISLDKGETWTSLDEGDGPELIDGDVWLVSKEKKRLDRNWDRLHDVMGWDKSFLSLQAESTWTPRDVEIDVDEEEYNGKKRFKVQWINKPGGGPRRKSASLTRLQELAAKWDKPQPQEATQTVNPFRTPTAPSPAPTPATPPSTGEASW